MIFSLKLTCRDAIIVYKAIHGVEVFGAMYCVGVGIAPPSLPSRGSGVGPSSGPSLLLISGGILGAALLLANLAIFACCIKRRNNKRLTGNPHI